jgi:hypothetical protein
MRCLVSANQGHGFYICFVVVERILEEWSSGSWLNLGLWSGFDFI